MNTPTQNKPLQVQNFARREKMGDSFTFERILSSALVVLAAWVAFGQALRFGVIVFDDDKIIGVFTICGFEG